LVNSHGAAAQENHQHALTEEEVGSVKFSTSCSPSLESKFNRAVALLHSFQYEQVRQAFTEIDQERQSEDGGEGADVAAFEAERLLAMPRVVPYDAFALWMHHARGRIASPQQEARHAG